MLPRGLPTGFARTRRRGDAPAALLFLLISSFCVLAGRPARAGSSDGDRKEELDIYTAVEFTYDDNVELVDRKPEDDCHVNLIAGFSMTRRAPKRSLTLEYQFRYRDYLEFDEYDQAEHAGYLAYRFEGNGWMLSVDDRIIRTEDPAGMEFTERQRRLRNDANARVGFRLAGGGQLVLGYRNSRRDYREDEWEHLSGSESAGDLEVSVPVASRTRVFASVSLGRYRFDDDELNGYRYRRGVLGLRGQPGRKLAFEVGVGVDDLDDFDDNLDDDDDEGTELYAFVRATWRIRPNKTRLELTFRRDDQPSTKSNYQVVTSGTLEILHRFLPRISGAAGASVESGDRTRGDDFDIWRGWLGLRYKIGRGSGAYFRYEHAERESTGNGPEYDVNRLSLGLTHSF